MPFGPPSPAVPGPAVPSEVPKRCPYPTMTTWSGRRGRFGRRKHRGNWGTHVPFAPNTLLVTSSKALVTSSVPFAPSSKALVTSSVPFAPSSKALVTSSVPFAPSSKALVTSSVPFAPFVSDRSVRSKARRPRSSRVRSLRSSRDARSPVRSILCLYDFVNIILY